MDNIKRKQYNKKYAHDNYRQFGLVINKHKYPDMIAWLESQDNIQAYIRKLIENDMKKNA